MKKETGIRDQGSEQGKRWTRDDGRGKMERKQKTRRRRSEDGRPGNVEHGSDAFSGNLGSVHDLGFDLTVQSAKTCRGEAESEDGSAPKKFHPERIVMALNRLFLSPPHMGSDELEFVKEAFDSNYIAPLGPMVDAFEREFAEYTGIKYCVALSSGTAAMHLALRVLGSGFRVQGSGFRVLGSGFKVRGSGFRVVEVGERRMRFLHRH